jgi:hypothetical protein
MEPNRTTCPSRSDVGCCGPGPEILSALRVSRLEGASSSSLKLRGARRRWSPIAHHVSLGDLTAPTSPDTFVGPGPNALGASRVLHGDF